MSIPLALIGDAVLEVIGLNPKEFDYSSEATWVGQAVFDDEIYWQPTAGGEETLRLRLAARPHVMGQPLLQYELLKAHHKARDVVPYIRLVQGYTGEMMGDVGIRRIGHTEEKLAPDGRGYRHEFEVELIFVGRSAGGFE